MARKTQASGEDRFVETSLRLLGWARENSRTLILAGGALAVLAFAAKYYLDYREQIRNAAAGEMRSIRIQLNSGDPGPAVDQLRSFLVQFGSTPYAREARVLLAQSLLLQNRAREAIQPARSAAEDLGDDPLANRAALLLAAAYEEVGDTANAISTYQELGRRAEARMIKTRAWEGAARLAAARGDASTAVSMYDRLAELVPEGSAAHSLYRMRAEELRTEPLGAGNGVGPEDG